MSNEPDPEAGELTFPGLRAQIASPKHLLAMKLRSSRPGDTVDLEHLFVFLGITTPQEAVDITAEFFDDSYVAGFRPAEWLFLAQDVFDAAARAGRQIT